MQGIYTDSLNRAIKFVSMFKQRFYSNKKNVSEIKNYKIHHAHNPFVYVKTFACG